MSTLNISFGSTLGKIGLHIYIPVLQHKGGVLGGIYYTNMFYFKINHSRTSFERSIIGVKI